MSGSRGTVSRAIVWSGGGAVALRAGQFGIGIVIARIMSPYDFGVFAVVLVVYSLIVNVSEIGIGSALIRVRGSVDRLAPTAVTLSAASSIVLGTGMWFAAPLVASLMRAPGAGEAIQVMSLVVVLAGFSSVPLALITRNFRQDRKFIADMANFVVSNILLIILALAGLGVMALAWSRVAGQLVSVITLVVLAPRRYRPGFNRGAAKTLIRFGAPFVGANLVGYGVGNVDAIVVGRILGPVQLGTYALANNVAGWPLSLFTSVLNSVGLPVLSKIAHSAHALRDYLANATFLLTGVFFYVSAMCAGLAQPLVDAVYGPKWSAAGPVLAILAVYGSVRVLLALLFDALIACNSPRSLLLVQGIWLVALVPGMLGGAMLGGLVGAAASQVLIALLVSLPASFLFLRHASGVKVLPIVFRTVLPLTAAVSSAVIAHVVAGFVDNAWLALLLGGCAGTAVYAAVMFRSIVRTRDEVRRLYGSDVTHFSPHDDSVSEAAAPLPPISSFALPLRGTENRDD
ncbi:lipopolysaccharide biosynthesis protein [Cryobacterium sp. CG_9.6]|uniref:lipopolysaccharide biosynthesis protein n=1 Tax=Cryobacterium sp. CG_9.6 TaxID=2760710 RepID=UPI0024761CCF|nr:lipopolysaccharide biosynthesis protein [Cryobacterium sp. CG_9.6]MDH6238279.1 PST family polysaccharide transporter [Cryobacterium sp. CG_9.6]